VGKTIFEIVGADAVLRVPKLGKEFKLNDPPFLKKVLLQKKWKDLSDKQQSGELDYFAAAELSYELNKEQIQLYFPDIVGSDLDAIGEFEFNAILSKVMEMIGVTFGAQIKKIEDSSGKF
jgi:hypothetical protein